MWLQRSNSNRNRNSFSSCDRMEPFYITFLSGQSTRDHSVVIGIFKHCCGNLCTSVELFYICVQFDSLSVVLIFCRQNKSIKIGEVRGLRLAPRCRRDLWLPYRRFGTTCRSRLLDLWRWDRSCASGQPIGPDILTLEDGTARLSRNVGAEWPLYAS